ncbi:MULTISPECIES: VOC family protein [unclassified Pseudoalteromonas]|uniref:VOC family protein n=1 Tax=unclassified Pseudoalteromonas TaxID=194690 RepID=UPI00040187A8|nr:MULTISPECIES: VOC family protein [unclassified Pseudoalteromonas]MBH0062511.1 VOC family protein [Pseudoalteromonas sp. NZS71]PKH91780.1 glyoxalase family protein [Pseudoalteromonas sp. 78C3]
MSDHEKLNYVEFPACDLPATKAFFSHVFNWQFTDYGPEYTAFSEQGLDGGIFQAPLKSLTQHGAALLIFYSDDIHATFKKVETFGGVILKPIFEFPGGCRFHFTEPSGNEFAVWAKEH